MSPYTNIVVGTDGSDTSMLAVDRASALASQTGATLLIVTAYQPTDDNEVQVMGDILKQETYLVVGSAPAQSMLRDAATRARCGGATQVDTLAAQGLPVEVLQRAVTATGADLLVVGNVGLNTLAGRILGSVPQQVARRAGVDVLIAHTTDAGVGRATTPR